VSLLVVVSGCCLQPQGCNLVQFLLTSKDAPIDINTLKVLESAFEMAPQLKDVLEKATQTWLNKLGGWQDCTVTINDVTSLSTLSEAEPTQGVQRLMTQLNLITCIGRDDDFNSIPAFTQSVEAQLGKEKVNQQSASLSGQLTCWERADVGSRGVCSDPVEVFRREREGV
jgi:hypothetical protein